MERLTVGSRWRHVRRETVYKIVGRALGQSDFDFLDGCKLVVYRSETSGDLYVSEIAEFIDGRFELVGVQP